MRSVFLCLFLLTVVALTGCTKEQEFLIIGGCELKPRASCPGVDLSGQNLAGLELSSSNFKGANFDAADLSSSLLIGTDLSEATLRSTDLRAANLSNADLSNANLEGANMEGTSITGVIWFNTTCPDGSNSDAHADTCAQNLTIEGFVNNEPNNTPNNQPCDLACPVRTPFCEDETVVSDTGEGVVTEACECDYSAVEVRLGCADGDRCVGGECGCDPNEHVSDSDNCGCQGPCEEDELCSQEQCRPSGFVRVPAGTFMMGSPPDEPGRRSDRETQHEVTLTRPFLMQTTEVTQGQWRALMGNNPSEFTACGDDCPVEEVSFFDAVLFANRKSVSEGLEPCYDDQGVVVGDPDGNPSNCEGYRLPTEAEWEYAARGGTQTEFFTGAITQTGCDLDANLNRAGWYCGNADSTTHPVGEKEVNALGLYDLHGNVREWVHDLYQANYEALSGIDPVNTESGSFRVERGGSWSYAAHYCRAAYRDFHDPRYRNNSLGFRLVRSIH